MAGRFPSGSEAPSEFSSARHDQVHPNDFEPPEPGEIDCAPLLLEPSPSPFANVGYPQLKRR